MTKYAANAMLATRISFMNEIANLCERSAPTSPGAQGHRHRRRASASRFLFPGVGYGGSCFPKDVKAVVKTAEEHGYSSRSCRRSRRSTRSRSTCSSKGLKHFGGNLEGQALRGLGPGVQAEDRRHARGAERWC
jgi:UDPglucose 6-dehydrogenase